MRKINIKRVLKITVLAVAGIMLLLLVCLAFLPSIVSTHAVQNLIQKKLSSSMKRQVAWSNLDLSWSNGLALSGLKLGDGPAPLLKTDIDQIVLSPSFSRGTDGRFAIDLTVKVQNVRAELAPGPPKPKPPPPAKDPLTLLAELIQRIQELDYELPVELRATVEVVPLQVVYHAPAPGRQLKVQDFAFRFAMPSLDTKPITADLSGLVSVDGRDMGKVSLNAKVSDLVTKERRVRLASALFAADAAAPGTTLKVSGGLAQTEGFAARLKLDLPGLLAVAHPFLPPKVPKLEGKVELQLRAKTNKNRDLRADLTVTGAGVAASGGSLKAKRVGPLDMNLKQQIATDHLKQRVDFPGGTLNIPSLVDASWSASVKDPTVPDRSLELKFGPLRLDLARAHLLAAPFMPPGSPVKELAGEASLRSLSLHLNGPRNRGDLALAGFGIKLPHVRLALKKGELSADDIDLLLERMECPLSAKLPTSLTADLLWSIRKAALSGAQPVSLQMAGGKAGVVVTDLNLKSDSPRKVSASATLTQSFDLDRVSFANKFDIGKVHEQLRLTARAAENGEIEADLPEFAVTAASLGGTAAGKRFGPVPLSASLTASGLQLSADKGARPTLQRAVTEISAGDFLQMSAEAALAGASPQRATTSGKAKLDLRRAMPLAAPFVPAGMKGDGVVSVVWDLATPLAEKGGVAEKNPLKNAKAQLSQFDKLELGMKLDNINATVPSAKGAITVTGLHTKPDLHVVSTKNGEAVRINGGVQIAGLSGLSGAAGKLPAQHGSFSFNGELLGWKELRLGEELRIDPLALSHEAELNVNRLDTLLDEKQPFSTATLIKRLDVTLFANVEAAFSKKLAELLPGIALAGSVSGSARADLTAGRELALRCALKTRDFGVQLINGTKVEGMRSDIAINRVYALAATTKGEGWTPLSAALVRPAAVATANPGAAEIAGRIHDDLRGDVRGARSFSIRRVTTKASGVPLELTALEGDLLFSQDKFGLSFFQADLLGGTLLARSVFELLPEIPVITAASSFSNLDITYLLPKEAGKRQEVKDAEITGEMNLTAPLTPDQRELFEQLRLAVNVRKIGANTIERALFSLDPYERNEQLVAQRKMLRLGGLKGLRANAVDGAFSMEGEAQIKGVAVDLPKVERLRISELPLRQELVKNRAGIMALRGYLDLLRADTLVVGPKGELSLKRRMYVQ